MNTFFFYTGLISTLGNFVLFIFYPSWILATGFLVGCWSLNRLAKYI